MMHNATEGLKFRRFVRRLRGLLNEWAGLPVDVETIAVGLLERLWHIGIREQRNGRLGEKFANADICELIGWAGDPDALVECFVAERWLDVVDGVLVIHDWDENKPNFLKAIDSREAKRAAAQSAQPSSVPSSAPSSQPSNQLGRESGLVAGVQPSAQPVAHTKPNVTKPNQTKPKESVKTRSLASGSGDGVLMPKAFADSAEFAQAWRLWESHRVELCKPLNPVQAEAQLMDLLRFGPDEAAAVVMFSIQRGAMNLITDGGHKREAVAVGGGIDSEF